MLWLYQATNNSQFNTMPYQLKYRLYWGHIPRFCRIEVMLVLTSWPYIFAVPLVGGNNPVSMELQKLEVKLFQSIYPTILLFCTYFFKRKIKLTIIFLHGGSFTGPISSQKGSYLIFVKINIEIWDSRYIILVCFA